MAATETSFSSSSVESHSCCDWKLSILLISRTSLWWLEFLRVVPPPFSITQLIVQQNQEAVFFRDGRAIDNFGPGRYTLTTANIPIISQILTIPWQKSPFQACVYFVGKQTFLDQRWGTRQPLTLRDKDFGMVRLRGFGKFAYRVVDAVF